MNKLLTILVIFASVACVQSLGFRRQVDSFQPDVTAISGDGRYGDVCFFDDDVLYVAADVGDDTIGKVFVYTDSGETEFTLSQTLTGGDDEAVGDMFGRAIFHDGSELVIGAPGADLAFLLERNEGAYEIVLVIAPLGVSLAGSNYGYSVGVSEGIIAVGGPTFSVGGTSAGAVWIFDRDLAFNADFDEFGLRTRVNLGASTRAAGDWFGSAVYVEGDYLYVAGIGRNSNAGAVYVFNRDEGGSNEWGMVTQLDPGTLSAETWFGASLGVDGDVIVVGAPTDGSTTFGQAHVFYREGGNTSFALISTIRSADAQAGDMFGEDLHVQGDFLYVGAQDNTDADDEDEEGAVFLFFRDEPLDDDSGSAGTDEWGQVQKITSFEDKNDIEEAFDNFGSCVSAWSDYVLIGAAGLDDDFGQAYVFGTVSSSASALSSSFLESFSYPLVYIFESVFSNL